VTDSDIDALLYAIAQRSRELNAMAWAPMCGPTWESERAELRAVVRQWLRDRQPESMR
jgi:hypothetical protein